VNFVQRFNGIQHAIYVNAEAKGFWKEDHGLHTDATKIMLVVTELAEAIEALRKDKHQASEKIPQFTLVEEELADAVIRIMDLAGGRGYRLAEAILEKVQYNQGRPYKHGREF
jgi:NTP pyrophosphatase (non-canonical NTP hydrolase)